MAGIRLLDELEEFIREKIEKERWTHKRMSLHLQYKYPSRKGLSVRSLERFCRERNIHKTSRLTKPELDEVVAAAVSEVGPVYGRRTFTGVLASRGIRTGEKRVGESLRYVSPVYCRARTNSTARMTNPTTYRADYFGHKLHIDQNEKNVMFGVTHICAVDGFNRKIVAFSTMPIKNNSVIYDTVYRQTICQYGMWDQIRVDHGREWYLMLYIQEHLAGYRRNPSGPPHLQTSSTQNHVIKRIWVEVNGRVNYPIKAALIEMQENGDFKLEDDHIKHCVSWYTLHVSQVGTTMFVTAWNEHRISGTNKGIPNVMMARNNQTKQIDNTLVPAADEAVRMYEENGGHITIFNEFGQDPLRGRQELLTIRKERFAEQWPSFGNIFHSLVNGDNTMFHDGLLCFINISMQLTAQL
ncbi:uncharacterized protein [Dysidea avara]|uniref:uncharacterized protein n=1 Tax=Dysidea avara TaxID=196820 RepID=UPI0033304DBC